MMGVELDPLGRGLAAVDDGAHVMWLWPEPCWKYGPLRRRDGRWFVWMDCMEFA